MRLKKLKPTTPSQRWVIQIKNKELNKNPLLKFKINGYKNQAGRNNKGKITVRHKGGGHKKNYRQIDFFRNYNSTGVVISIEYDPNRTANIASIFDFLDNKYYYIIAPENLKIGNIVKSGLLAELKLGHTLPIHKLILGSVVHNISLKKTKFGQISRAAGCFAKLIKKDEKFATFNLSSKKKKKIPIDCIATIGKVSNCFNFLKVRGKAGRSRWLNIRPSVRGVAMNPVDHPHGGGEGKKSGCGKTPWGKPTKKGKLKK